MAVVKANAYGHGMIEVAQRALKCGAEFLGVARLDEAIRLREAGIDSPVLIFGYTPPARAGELIEFGLTQTVSSYPNAEALSRAAASQGKIIKIHLKVDTGMGRLGILADHFRPHRTGMRLGCDVAGDAVREIELIARLPGLKVDGLFTHLATADSADKSYANNQFERFLDLIEGLRAIGVDTPLKHAANSAAIIDLPETHLDMVRAGISLYGLYPSGEVNKHRITLKPAMTLKSMVVHLKTVPPGFKVGYGCTHETVKQTVLATIPIGYADGYNRHLSSRGWMLVRGRKAPVVGRVCMDLTILDVGHIPDVRLEDEVVLFGRQGDSAIHVDEIAATLETINYEVVSTISDRVPRWYLRD
jgi:alanine racemase